MVMLVVVVVLCACQKELKRSSANSAVALVIQTVVVLIGWFWLFGLVGWRLLVCDTHTEKVMSCQQRIRSAFGWDLRFETLRVFCCQLHSQQHPS